MGRIKTQLIKRATEQLMTKHPDQLGEDFVSNKAFVDKFVSVHSTKLRNTIAGYVTRLIRMRKVKGI